ncbi:MAG: elongation factor 1-beta [Candidatus Aenigmarchaeota archaeon ex4484_224]|nr:MAG: elongation factor 1-beta [Candidatus Aenigmarchaeota archaeon ex4484_224]
MGNVLVKIRVMSENVEINLDELENEIKEKINPEKVEREPIAFGLVALIIYKIIPDDAKYLEEIENKLKEIEGIKNLEVLQVSRTL